MPRAMSWRLIFENQDLDLIGQGVIVGVKEIDVAEVGQHWATRLLL
jgi:hypothetical protein